MTAGIANPLITKLYRLDGWFIAAVIKPSYNWPIASGSPRPSADLLGVFGIRSFIKSLARLLLPLWHKPLWFRLALAVLAVAAATGSRLMLPVLGLPYLLFIPLLMALAFFLGLWPGLAATVASAVAAAYLFVGTAWSFDLSLEQWLGALLYSLVNFGIVGVCATLRITYTQLKEAAAALERRAEVRTRERDLIWESSPDMLCTASLGGLILSANAAWTQTLGWNEEELRAGGYPQLVHPEDRERTERSLEELRTHGKVTGFENRYRGRDGQFRWLSWSSVMRDEVIYCNVRDITQSKLQAEALARAEDQLRQSQKMEAVGQLTGGIAHDFNNLLTSITGSLDLMQIRLRQGRVGDIDRYIGTAQGAARRAASLTHRLLAFSRRQTLDPSMTDANGLVTGMLELIERSVGPGIRIETHLDVMLWTTLCDANQLENALLNLCLNARDAMSDGGLLTIYTQNLRLDADAAAQIDLAPDDYICIAVHDTGTGMSPEVARRAFDPFFTTKPIGAGTGLGLSMIYGFARQSGGVARIESTLGEGTCVRLYLPRYLGLPASIRPLREQEPVLRTQRACTVLVVDDEASVRELIVEVLGEASYTVLEAHDGESGLQLLRSDIPIDLLVSDVGLTGALNGRQMADAARQVRPHLPVLFITGYAESSVIEGGSLPPNMEVLTKPFAMDVLCTRIESMLSSAPTRSSPTS